jgi:hypothetical protein
MREIGVPDVEGWRHRVDAMQETYDHGPRYRRALWWVRGRIDSIGGRAFIWRRSRELEAGAHAEFLARHPDYAAAVARGDKKTALPLLAMAIAEDKTAVVATPGYRRLLGSRLREQGFSEADIAAADAMLGNIDHDKRKN